jgi:hypothetical protein
VSPSDDAPRPRPVLRADLAALGGRVDPSVTTRAELAAATAAAVVAAGRDEPGERADRLIALADEVGLDTLAELWREAEPASLAGALWAIYLLRTWSRTDADGLARLWRAGCPYTPADEVVAGVGDEVGPDRIAETTDAVLRGAYSGEFDVALERAAAFFRVIAAGRRALAPDGADGAAELDRAERNDRAADGLAWAAVAWRDDALH